MSFPLLRRFALFACTASLPCSSFSAENWTPLGLRDYSVNCILAEDTMRIFAGTDKGVSIYWSMGQTNNWSDAYTGLPVHAIARINSSTVVAAAGMGTFSDGLYIGRDVLDGPPFYAFTIGQFCLWPTALALKDTIIESDTMTLVYAGSQNGISVGRFIKDTLHALAEIPMPENAFGVEMPHCSAIELSPVNHTLYAGGYDRSPEPGPGSFLELVSDSLHIIRRLNVTAMTNGSFMPEASRPELLIGTSDSGVFRYTPTPAGWNHLGSPLPGQAIHSVCAIRRSPVPADFPIAAVDSGVFSGSDTGDQTDWAETGDIPATPRCVVVSPFMRGTQVQLMAGTDSGVYVFGPEAQVTNRFRAASPAPCFIAYSRDRLSISLPARITLPVCLTITALSGARIEQVMLQSYDSAVALPGYAGGVFVVTVRDTDRGIIARSKVSVMPRR
ncbi:MAG: hypothetical protein JXA71_01585 [Chitinispirillaceae bacterium]|nr:hypothetical protein [Chitinispirillaceae bacterium]